MCTDAAVGPQGLALRQCGEQHPYRGGDDGACHHPVYGRCKLDGDRGRERDKEGHVLPLISVRWSCLHICVSSTG